MLRVPDGLFQRVRLKKGIKHQNLGLIRDICQVIYSSALLEAQNIFEGFGICQVKYVVQCVF